MASVAIVDLDASGSDLTTYPFTLFVTGNAAATYAIGGGGRATAAGRTVAAIRCDGVNVPILPGASTTVDVTTTSNAIAMGVIRAADLPVPTNASLAVEMEFSGAMIRCGVGVAETSRRHQHDAARDKP